jgi:hypothetical protein
MEVCNQRIIGNNLGFDEPLVSTKLDYTFQNQQIYYCNNIANNKFDRRCTILYFIFF